MAEPELADACVPLLKGIVYADADPRPGAPCSSSAPRSAITSPRPRIPPPARKGVPGLHRERDQLPHLPRRTSLAGDLRVGQHGPRDARRHDWPSDVAVHYWGDIDTHGFAILDRFRARLPNTASLLMDEPTLLAHRDSWVVEERQQRRDLPSLTDAEAQLYAGLREGRWGDRVRLEQEFVRFGAVKSALRAALAR